VHGTEFKLPWRIFTMEGLQNTPWLIATNIFKRNVWNKEKYKFKYFKLWIGWV